MRWRWWRRDKQPEYEIDADATRAQTKAEAQYKTAKAQAPKVAAAEKGSQALRRQTERLAAEVDKAMRLRGTT